MSIAHLLQLRESGKVGRREKIESKKNKQEFQEKMRSSLGKSSRRRV